MVKSGDKIKIKYCVDENVEANEVYEVFSTQNSRYEDKELIMIKINNMPKWFLTNANQIEFEIVKENEDMKELIQIKTNEHGDREGFVFSTNGNETTDFVKQIAMLQRSDLGGIINE